MSTGPLAIEVGRLRRRVRILLAERYGLFGAAAGCLAAAAMVLVSSRLESLLDYRLWIAVPFAGAVAGIAVGLLVRLGDMTVAVAADKRAGLEERLSSAVAIGPHADEHDMAGALLTDARTRAHALRPSDVFKHRFCLPHYVFGASLLVLLLAIFLPLMPALQSQIRREEVRLMKKQGARLVKIAKEIKREAPPKKEELKKLGARLGQLGQKMQTGRMTRKSAMLQTKKLNKAVQKLEERLAEANGGKKSLAQAALDMRKTSDELEAQGKEGKTEAGKAPPVDPKLSELARKEGPLTQSEKKELEKLVSKYTNPNSNLPVPPELGEALAKLAQNEDFQKASELMQKLAQKLNSGKMSAQDQKNLKKQLDALAKALKNTDLDKLAKMMRENAEKLAKLSPEQLKKLAQQMARMQKMASALAKANKLSMGIGMGLGQIGMSMQMGQGSGKGGPGSGAGTDNRNTGPRGKIQDVKDVSKSASQVGESGMVFSAGQTKGAPDTTSAATVPYTDVLPDYKKAAENALAKEKVPPAYRKRVKDYFGSLNR